MTQIQHTPTPWKILRIDKKDSAEFIYVIGIETELGTVRMASIPRYNEEDEANAEFIVRACNCHDELVAALEGLQDAFIHTDGNTRGNKAKTNMIMHNQHDVPAALTAARYALDKARGK